MDRKRREEGNTREERIEEKRRDKSKGEGGREQEVDENKVLKRGKKSQRGQSNNKVEGGQVQPRRRGQTFNKTINQKVGSTSEQGDH